jgi:hypothetical protein
MPEAQKTAGTYYRHWVSFAHGQDAFALVLPDRRLYDAFASWLRGQGPQGYSFPHAGQDMCVNFAHVQRMELEEVASAEAVSPKGGLINPVPLREPPPLE